MQNRVLKYAHEIERGDILLVEDREFVIVTVNPLPETKSVHLELHEKDGDPFDVRDAHFDSKDLFIIRKTV